MCVFTRRVIRSYSEKFMPHHETITFNRCLSPFLTRDYKRFHTQTFSVIWPPRPLHSQATTGGRGTASISEGYEPTGAGPSLAKLRKRVIRGPEMTPRLQGIVRTIFDTCTRLFTRLVCGPLLQRNRLRRLPKRSCALFLAIFLRSIRRMVT